MEEGEGIGNGKMNMKRNHQLTNLQRSHLEAPLLPGDLYLPERGP